MYANFLQTAWKGVAALMALGLLATPAWAGLGGIPVPEPGLTALLAGGLAAAALIARFTRRK